MKFHFIGNPYSFLFLNNFDEISLHMFSHYNWGNVCDYDYRLPQQPDKLTSVKLTKTLLKKIHLLLIYALPTIFISINSSKN